VDRGGVFGCQATIALAGALPVMMTANSAHPTTAKRLIHTGFDRFGWTSRRDGGSAPADMKVPPRFQDQTRPACAVSPRLAAHRCVANASIPIGDEVIRQLGPDWPETRGEDVVADGNVAQKRTRSLQITKCSSHRNFSSSLWYERSSRRNARNPAETSTDGAAPATPCWRWGVRYFCKEQNIPVLAPSRGLSLIARTAAVCTKSNHQAVRPVTAETFIENIGDGLWGVTSRPTTAPAGILK
jgi:hypothetical protein